MRTRYKTVAVFGGAFDPPTTGHAQVARGVLSDFSVGVDEVWVMPAFTHTYGKDMTDFDTRMHMCRLAMSDIPGVVVSDFEEKVSGRPAYLENSTLKTLFELMHDYPRHNFKIVIGLDNALDIRKWRYSERLLEIASFIVIPRPGYVHDPHAWYADDLVEEYNGAGHIVRYINQHHYLGHLSTGDVSSTQARWMLSFHEGDDVCPPQAALLRHLDRRVLDYIRERKLYLNKKKMPGHCPPAWASSQ